MTGYNTVGASVFAPMIHYPYTQFDPLDYKNPAFRIAALKHDEGDMWTLAVGYRQTRTLHISELPDVIREKLAIVSVLFPEDPNPWYTKAYEPINMNLDREDADASMHIGAMLPPTAGTDPTRWELVHDYGAGWRVCRSLYCLIVPNEVLKKLQGGTDENDT